MRIFFTTRIKARRDKVWSVLCNKTYKLLTDGLNPENDWKQGSSLELVCDGNSVSCIVDRLVPGELMSFRNNGLKQIQSSDEENRKWSGSSETFYLNDRMDFTDLDVELDVPEEFETYFNEIFPETLEKVKQIAESDQI